MYSLWWPNGHGIQKLYNIDVEYTCNNETSSKSIRLVNADYYFFYFLANEKS